jgi:hypothetical protein
MVLASFLIHLTSIRKKNLGAFKSSVFWEMIPCSLLKANRSFGETRIVYIFRVEEYTKQETNLKQIESLCFELEDGDNVFKVICHLTFNRLHGVIP